MRKDEIKPGMLLRNKKTGEIGIPFTGYDYGCTDPAVEVPMVYKGGDKNPTTPFSDGTLYEDLEPCELKPEDMFTPEHIKKVCKPGQGGSTCRYLAASADGFSCAKVEASLSVARYVDDQVYRGEMNAKAINCGGRFGHFK